MFRIGCCAGAHALNWRDESTPMSSTQANQARNSRIEIRTAERRVLIDGNAAKLGARAFDVLQALYERRDRLVTKNELFEVVWPGVVVEENNLQVQISTLRKLLAPGTIATVPGRGYQYTGVDAAEAVRTGHLERADASTHAARTLGRSRTVLGASGDAREINEQRAHDDVLVELRRTFAADDLE